MTWTDGQVLTAAQMNTHLRDNMMETETAKATLSGGGFFVATGRHNIEERAFQAERVDVSESLTSGTDFGDLATVGPRITVTTGSKVFLMLSCRMEHASTANQCAMSYEVAGATEREAGVTKALTMDGIVGANNLAFGYVDFVTALNPGEHTFTAKYRGSNATFNNRQMIIFPM